MIQVMRGKKNCILLPCVEWCLNEKLVCIGFFTILNIFVGLVGPKGWEGEPGKQGVPGNVGAPGYRGADGKY